MLKQRNMTSLILRDGDRYLLLYRQGGRVADGQWVGAAGGHFEKDELNDARACVLRELNEELSLDETALEGLSLRYITLRNKGGEIRVNYYYFASLREPMAELKSNEGQLRWFNKEEIAALEMPYSFRYVMRHYLAKGQYDSALYGGITAQDGVHFTELYDF